MITWGFPGTLWNTWMLISFLQRSEKTSWCHWILVFSSLTYDTWWEQRLLTARGKLILSQSHAVNRRIRSSEVGLREYQERHTAPSMSLAAVFALPSQFQYPNSEFPKNNMLIWTNNGTTLTTFSLFLWFSAFSVQGMVIFTDFDLVFILLGVHWTSWSLKLCLSPNGANFRPLFLHIFFSCSISIFLLLYLLFFF